MFSEKLEDGRKNNINLFDEKESFKVVECQMLSKILFEILGIIDGHTHTQGNGYELYK